MAALHPPRVFISATSGDLGSIRTIVKEALLSIDCMPVEQTNFSLDYREVTELLKSRIAESDAVIHVVGCRYGAEPDPEQLPPGTFRRSYTQLEYDYARQLGKRIYTFICTEDFPYDSGSEPETDDKRSLQIAHRTQLLHGSHVYQHADTPDIFLVKVRELQLQLEELSRQFAVERHRQFLAWCAVGIALIVLTVIGWMTSRNFGRELATSKEIQQKTVSSVEAVDTKVDALLRSDFLDTISAKAKVDASTIRQYLLQAKEQSASPLQYAKTLSEEGRHDAALALTLYVGEAAIDAGISNFRASAEAFHFAGQERQKLSHQPGANLREGLIETAAILQRAQDACLAVKTDEAGRTELLAEILSLRAECLSQIGWNSDTFEQMSFWQQTVQTVKSAEKHFQNSPKIRARNQRLLAKYQTDLAMLLSEPEARELLREVTTILDSLRAQLDPETDTELWTLAIGTQARARIDLASLISTAEAQPLIEASRLLCEQASQRDGLKAFAQVRAENLLRLGQLLLWQSHHALSVAEEKAQRSAAREHFQQALEVGRAAQGSYSEYHALLGLAHCDMAARNWSSADKHLTELSEKGLLSGYKALTTYVEFAADSMITGRSVGDYLDDAKTTLSTLQESSTFRLAPRRHGELLLLEGKLNLALSKRPRFTAEREKELGRASENIASAAECYQRVVQRFPMQDSPRLWALGQRCLGETQASPEVLEQALTVYTRESDPRIWARIIAQIGFLRKDRKGDLITPLTQALEIYGPTQFPADFLHISDALSLAHVNAVQKTKEPAQRRSHWRESLRHALLARHWHRYAGWKSSQQFDFRLSNIEFEAFKVLTPEEKQQFAADLLELTAEVEKIERPPLPTE